MSSHARSLFSVRPGLRSGRELLAVTMAMHFLGCAATQPQVEHPEPSQPAVVDMEGMRIQASQGEQGIEFETYDASELFRRAMELVNSDRCEDGVALYDRLVDEFPHSRLISSALYNAGLCLRQEEENEEAALRFERLLRDLPDSTDQTHARFMLAELYLRLERWEEARAVAEAIEQNTELSVDEQMEAKARRAQALLGLGDLVEAREYARGVLRFARRRAEGEIRNTFFTAAANYVYAETMRLEAQSIEVPEGTLETQRDVLETRAQLVLDAQREYFNTMRYHHAYWSAASGYRIGSMYDEMWRAIDDAPVSLPDENYTDEEETLYRESYRETLRLHIKPLLRHSIRYWELTLRMVERTGVQTEWTADIRRDLERVRLLLAEQPEEAEDGTDAEATPAAATERPNDVENASSESGSTP